jgi:hypothetical protein
VDGITQLMVSLVPLLHCVENKMFVIIKKKHMRTFYCFFASIFVALLFFQQWWPTDDNALSSAPQSVTGTCTLLISPVITGFEACLRHCEHPIDKISECIDGCHQDFSALVDSEAIASQRSLTQDATKYKYDINDASPTYKETREAYLNAANQLKLSTGPFNAARDAYIEATNEYMNSLYN